MKNKERLDVLLVSRGLAESRAKAQALIMSGQVYVDNQKADKAGASFAQDAAIEVRGDACPYVSRGHGPGLPVFLRNAAGPAEGSELF